VSGDQSPLVVAIDGPSGAGKSTLLGCVTKSVSCRMSGSISYAGTNILGLRTDAIIARGLVLVPEGRQLFAELTVEENLRMGTYGCERGRNWRSDVERAYALFPPLRERRRQTAATLSGGEQQMVAIGRALMARPRMLLLDEPSMGLAPMLVEQIFQIIQEINKSGTTILLVEQNANMALSIAHRAYVLETGEVVLQGDAKELASNPEVRKAYLGE
jgi:branched-chain amino acid transport system ATP-binding protein